LKLPDRAEALTLLRKAGCPQNVIDHCLKVADLAVEVAVACAKRGVPVNLQLVEIGALLHDIGRAKTHGVEHGAVGGRMAVEMGLPDEVVRIVERHVGAGITLEEAVRLGLPPRDYTPQTVEEKIVCYADKRIDDGGRVSLNETLHKFAEELGEDHPTIGRLKALNEEIIKMAGQDFQ